MTDYSSFINVLIGLSVVVSVTVVSLVFYNLYRRTERVETVEHSRKSNNENDANDHENEYFDVEVVIPQPPKEDTIMNYELEITPEMLKSVSSYRCKNISGDTTRISFTLIGGIKPKVITNDHYSKAHQQEEKNVPNIDYESPNKNLSDNQKPRILTAMTSNRVLNQGETERPTSMVISYKLTDNTSVNEDDQVDEKLIKTVNVSCPSFVTIPDNVGSCEQNHLSTKSNNGIDFSKTTLVSQITSDTEITPNLHDVSQCQSKSRVMTRFRRLSKVILGHNSHDNKDIKVISDEPKRVKFQPIEISSSKYSINEESKSTKSKQSCADKKLSQRVNIRQSFLARQLDGNVMFDWLIGSVSTKANTTIHIHDIDSSQTNINVKSMQSKISVHHISTSELQHNESFTPVEDNQFPPSSSDSTLPSRPVSTIRRPRLSIIETDGYSK